MRHLLPIPHSDVLGYLTMSRWGISLPFSYSVNGQVMTIYRTARGHVAKCAAQNFAVKYHHPFPAHLLDKVVIL